MLQFWILGILALFGKLQMGEGGSCVGRWRAWWLTVFQTVLQVHPKFSICYNGSFYL